MKIMKRITDIDKLTKFLGVNPYSKKKEAKVVTWNKQQLLYVLTYHNGDNRNLTKAQLKKIAKSLDEDGYVFNGESCSFNTEGNITEWQHRIKELIDYLDDDETVDVTVVTGVAPESFTKVTTPLVRAPKHEVQRHLNKNGNPNNLKGEKLDKVVSTMGQFFGATGRGKLTLQNAVAKFLKWGDLSQEANETVKDFFEETDCWDGFRVRFAAFAMAMIHIGEKEVLVNFLNLLKNETLGLSKVKVITDFVTLFESKDVSYMKSTPKGKFVFYLCSTACDRLKKKEDGVIALDSSIAKCSHEHLVKKSSGSFYRKFHVNPDNIDINSVSYKTTSAKQAIEGVEARV